MHFSSITVRRATTRTVQKTKDNGIPLLRTTFRETMVRRYRMVRMRRLKGSQRASEIAQAGDITPSQCIYIQLGFRTGIKDIEHSDRTHFWPWGCAICESVQGYTRDLQRFVLSVAHRKGTRKKGGSSWEASSKPTTRVKLPIERRTCQGLKRLDYNLDSRTCVRTVPSIRSCLVCRFGGKSGERVSVESHTWQGHDLFALAWVKHIRSR